MKNNERCDKKKSFDSITEACKDRDSRPDDNSTAYKCEHCGKFHLSVGEHWVKRILDNIRSPEYRREERTVRIPSVWEK